MKIKFIVIAVTCIFLLVSCKTNTNRNEMADENNESAVSANIIPYNVAKNYFVKNNVYDDFLTLKITTQQDFDRYFGMATTMAQGGRPTQIMFDEGYVLAVIDKASDKNTTITPQSLTKKDDKIDFLYTVKEGSQQTFTTRAALILIVNNEYTGVVNFIKE